MLTKPATYARVAGVLYLIPLCVGPFSMMYVPSALIVPGDPSATSARLAASASLFRLGLGGEMTIAVTEVALAAVLYVLLKPAGRALAATAAFARLAMAAIQAANLLPALAALELIRGDPSSAAFRRAQLQTLALLALNLHGLGVHVWEVLFALHCLMVGVLVRRSGYLPGWLGPLMWLAAVGYAVSGFGNLFFGAGVQILAPFIALAAVLGEVPFLGWLLIKGVDTRLWWEHQGG
jgi:hypothetical protein